MKITDEFPKILKQMYDNCQFDLDIEITLRNNEVILAGILEIKLDIDLELLLKCYYYMVDAGYLIDLEPFVSKPVEKLKRTLDKRAKLTAKAIDFIESRE